MRPADDNETVLYEVNLDAEAAVEGPFDTWLRDHVADMLQLDGFLSAEILVDPAPPPGRVRRSVQYRLTNAEALERYLRDHAPRMRQRGIELFGNRFTVHRRTLAHREEFIRGKVSTENCLNCGEVLTGQHCSHCGQRAKVRVLSLGGLLRDLLGDITDYDSRLWRTLRPLAFKPGWLTREYLLGRRTLYTPPFRMYLTLSVLFFLATSFAADPGGGIEFGPTEDGGASLRLEAGDGTSGADGVKPKAAGATTPAAGDRSGAGVPAAKSGAASGPELTAEQRRIVDAFVRRLPESQRAEARREFERDIATMKPEDAARLGKIAEDPCGPDTFKVEIGPFGKKYEPRLRDACRKIVSDSKGFGRALYENIPKMMFIFLPIIAFVMFALYLGSGRYYVEHLLFFVHYHAFFFLCGLVVVLLDRSARLLDGTAVASGLRFAEGVLSAALVVYVPYYLYRAMRNVYGQGRVVTLAKYSLLGIGYIFFMVLTVVGLLAYTALTL